MRKCKKCKTELTASNMVIYPIASSDRGVWFNHKGCHWSDYCLIPEHIPSEQFKKYLYAKV